MRPLIRKEDRLLIDHGCNRFHSGDILAFKRGEIMIAHRIVLIRKRAGIRHYWTVGDNSCKMDPPVAAYQIIGKTIGIARMGGYVPLQGPLWDFTGKSVALLSLIQECNRRIRMRWRRISLSVYIIGLSDNIVSEFKRWVLKKMTTDLTRREVEIQKSSPAQKLLG